MKKRVLPVLVMIFLGFGCLWLTAEPDAVAAPDGNPACSRGEVDPFAPGVSDNGPPKMVQVQVEFVELPHETVTKLLSLRSPQSFDATDLRKQVQELVTKNEAKVLETQIVVCKSGQKATTESIHEFIYPTKHEPMTLPQTSKKSDEPMELFDVICNSPATPTAFDTRNVGSTLEVEPTIDQDNRLLDLRFVPEFVWHSGNTVWHEGKDLAGNPFKISQPDFYCVRLNTSITCISGQYSFVAALSPKDSKGELDTTRKVMVFVKCDILTVK